MKVAIMQPYFFPYVGYYSLAEFADRFIFFDTPQYISHGWINRNRILKADGDTAYITIPIKKAVRETAIKDIDISEDQKWKTKIWGQLTAYKKKAPYYERTIEFLHTILDKGCGKLSDLCICSVEGVCKYIGIECEFDVFSNMKTMVKSVSEPDEWALYITKEIGGDVYVNPPGGRSFFDKKKYDEMGIELLFLESNFRSYVQRIGKYIPGLSIIDALMFCDLKEIRDIISDFSISKV